MCTVDRFTKRFLSDIDGSPHFSMEVYIVKAESKKKFAQMSLLPLVLALFFIPLLWLVGSRIRHFETPWKDPWCDIFLKSRWYEDLKNNFPKCLTSKYTHTNTQIHKYTNTVCHTLLWLVGSRIRHFETLWKEPWCDTFLKSRWYEDLKNNVPKCLTSKYTNTNTQIHKYSLGQIWR